MPFTSRVKPRLSQDLNSRQSYASPDSCLCYQLESKAMCPGDTSSVAPAQQSAVFETIGQTPRGQLILKEIFKDQDFKPSLREEGFAASEKQSYKAASDDKYKATCVGDDKPDVIDLSELTCNKAERDMINQNSVHVQLIRFRG